MRRQLGQFAILAIALSLAVRVTGNSPVGMKSDADTTARAAAARPIQTLQVSEIGSGARVRLHLRAGNAITGTFVAPSQLGEAEYAARYEAWRRSSPFGAGLPRLGDTVSVRGIDGRTLAGTFRGFGWKQVLVSPADSAGVGQMPHGEIVALLGAAGDSVPGARLVELDRDGRLPRITALLIDYGGGTTRVPVDDIEVVERADDPHTGSLLLIVGIAAGVILVVVAVKSMADSAAEGCERSTQVTGSGYAPPAAPARPRPAPAGGH